MVALAVFDDENSPANIVLEIRVKLKKTLDEFGDDFEKTADGFVDYLLLDLDQGDFPIAVLEAKSDAPTGQWSRSVREGMIET